jgi:hypothetical protein
MNWRTASSVCGEVGFAAIELDDARLELPLPKAEAEKLEPSKEEEPPPALAVEGS